MQGTGNWPWLKLRDNILFSLQDIGSSVEFLLHPDRIDYGSLIDMFQISQPLSRGRSSKVCCLIFCDIALALALALALAPSTVLAPAQQAAPVTLPSRAQPSGSEPTELRTRGTVIGSKPSLSTSLTPAPKKSPSSLLEKPPLHALTLLALNFQGRDEVFRFLPTQKQLVFVPPWA